MSRGLYGLNNIDSGWAQCLTYKVVQFSSVAQSCLTLRPHGLQHARSPCPSPTPRVYSNSCLLSRWYHPTISSSVVPFSSHLQSFPSSGSFLMSELFESGGQVLEFQLQHQSFQWILRTDLLWDGLVGSPCSSRDSQESSPTPVCKVRAQEILFVIKKWTMI